RLSLALGTVVLMLAALLVIQARQRHTFELGGLESRFARAGWYVDRALPANALVITDYESGSVPFYSRRRTLAWGSLDPGWLDRAVAFARERGFEPYFLFERWEEPAFRQRFAGTGFGALDWPPLAEVASQVRVYRA